jgi:zinc transporter 1
MEIAHQIVVTIVKILLQRAPDHVDIGKIRQEIFSRIGCVLEIHDVHVWQLIDGLVIASMHIILSEKEVSNFNKISEKIHAILHEHGVHNSTIQPEYVKEVTI